MGEDNNYNNNKNEEYNKRKWTYICRDVILKRIIPIIIIVIFLNEAFDKNFSQNQSVFYILVAFKLVVGILIGLYGGTLEWKFNENLVEGNFRSIEAIKKKYIFIYGIIEWGLLVGVSYIKYPIKSVASIFIDFCIWIVIGYLFGIFSFKKVKPAYEKFIRD